MYVGHQMTGFHAVGVCREAGSVTLVMSILLLDIQVTRKPLPHRPQASVSSTRGGTPLGWMMG